MKTSCTKPRRRRWLLAAAAGCLLNLPAYALSPELLISHRLDYDVYRDGTLLGDGQIELKPANAADCWSYSQQAKPRSWLRWLSGDILEQSHVCIADGRLRPIAYRYSRDGVGAGKENFSLRFDWPRMVAINQNGDARPLAADTVDRLSLQLVLRDWLLSERAATGKEPKGEKEVRFIDRKKPDSYRFQIRAHEAVSTPAGTFNTVRLDRTDNSKRRSQFWLSPEHGYIVIKAEQQKDDDPVLQLVLRSLPTTAPR